MKLEEKLEVSMRSSYDENRQFEMPLVKVRRSCDGDAETNRIEVLKKM